jgi:hypothetical protein
MKLPSIDRNIISIRHSISEYFYRLYDQKEFVKRIESFGARYYLFLVEKVDDHIFGEKNSRRLKIIIILQLIFLLNCLRFIISYLVDNQTVRVLLMDITLVLSPRMGASTVIIICFESLISLWRITNFRNQLYDQA